MSQISRLNKISNCINYSLGLGYEKHIPIGNFSPYLGIEAGINFTNVKSNFIKLPANIIYFQQNLPNYLFKPKIGALFKLNDNVFVNLEGSYNWVISLNRDFTNPLYDDSYTAIFFGRKLPTLSIGVHYLFNEK